MAINRVSLRALASLLRLSPSAPPITVPPNLRGSVDAYRGGVLTGWAYDPKNPDAAVPVEARLGGVVVARERADRFREDLKAAKIGSGRHAFAMRLEPDIIAKEKLPGQVLEVYVVGNPAKFLGKLSISQVFQPDASQEIPYAIIQGMQERVLASLGVISPANGAEVKPPAKSAAAHPAYMPLLRAVGHEERAFNFGEFSRRPLLSPYAEQLRDRLNLKERFPGDDDQDHFYRWYIDEYGSTRYPHRAPFTAREISYLNEPIPLGGSKYALSRVALWYALDDVEIRTSLALATDPGYRRVAYWWASQKANALHVEDCLVSHRMETFLRAIPGPSQRSFLPLSTFMEEAFAHDPNLSWVSNMDDSQIRICCYFVVLLEAAHNPGILRFLPREVIDYFLLDRSPNFELVSTYIADRCESRNRLTLKTYQALIDRQGFDIARACYRTLTPDGDRIDAARLRPRAAADSRAFVQVIAPFEKTSGLATAGRSTRELIRHTGIPARSVNFSIDNPQPGADDSDYDQILSAGAAVNVIHINADLLPLVFAYSPDVFTGSYNVGFFFWELDKIPTCHRLALELVDEIWVASEYNRRCYAQATKKPVLNMRLAAQDLASIDVASARSEMNALAGTTDEVFIFFLTYDSLSYIQRKNPMAAIRAFREAFPDERDVRLVIKTHNASVINESGTSHEWRYLLDACQSDSRISLIDRTVSHETILQLVSAADCYVSLHRSEGFGLGMLEAMQLGTPVACTGYSGNADFCTPETAWLIEYDEVRPKAGDYAYAGPEHRWAEPRHASTVKILRAVRRNAAERTRRATNASELVSERYRPETLSRLIGVRIRQICSDRGIQI
ncbi:glycosyltransferase [Methylobacterium planeticum]|uniref:Glycosyltransferase family 4 protein n=1 Tax=Methylobacterium planeticum TaxID=2615211 RepID=A0A6N6MTU2_9HYPH|nr:glycosyltransferase [Methylobacterium planeticum]KAB1075100.1 glycosyltransferase family 4 protein [Methylobacterium planeticum]